MSMNFIDAIRTYLTESMYNMNGHDARLYLAKMVSAYDALAPDWADAPEWARWYAIDALAPDWADAPEWARWYAIDADGVATFFGVEPEWEMFEWVIDWRSDPDAPRYPNEPLILDAPKIDIPLGLDWRLLKWQRPEVAE